MDKNLLKADILKIIACGSESAPVKSYKIEESLNVKGSKVRDFVREMRREGISIAETKSGYYIAKSFEQIEPTINDLEGRASSMLKTAAALRKTFRKTIQYNLLFNE